MNGLRSLLRVGYLIECKNGERAICMLYKNLEKDKTDTVLDFYTGDSIDINEYDCELRYLKDENYNINKIYGLSSCDDETIESFTANRELIWERKTELKVGDRVRVKSLENTEKDNRNSYAIDKANSFANRTFDISILNDFLLSEIGTIRKVLVKDGYCILDFDLDRIEFVNSIVNGFLISPDDLELFIE